MIDKTFEKCFQHEINNRAFAYKGVTHIAGTMAGTDQEEFWQAFSKIEKISRREYSAS